MTTPKAGHNSEGQASFAAEQLKAFVKRIERVEESIKEAQDDRREIYGEVKSMGLDVKAVRTIVRMRKQDANERAEQETILTTYLDALGMN